MPAVELDIRLVEAKIKLEELRNEMRKTDRAAAEVKIGEQLVSKQIDGEIAKVAKLQQQLKAEKFEAQIKFLPPDAQITALSQRIREQLERVRPTIGPQMQSEAVADEIEINRLVARRAELEQQILATRAAGIARAAKMEAEEWAKMTAAPVNPSWGYHAANPFGAQMSKGQWAIGNAAMQIQDIAIQSQMGVNPAVIVAQQGSQLASAFGSTGMIVGGIAAIGGALVMAGAKGDETFNKLIEGAKEFHKELDTLVATGGVPELMSQMGKLSKQQDELQAARKHESSQGFLSYVSESMNAMLNGGKTFWEKELEARNAYNQGIADEITLRKRIVEISERDLQIATLKAQGHDKEAEALERRYKLEAEIAKIRASELDDATKNKLIGNKEKEMGLHFQKTDDDKAKREADHRRDQAERLADAERATKMAGMNDAQKLLAMNERRLELEQQIKAETNDDRKMELAQKRAEIEKEIVSMQMQMGKQGEQEAERRNKEIEAIKKELTSKTKELGKAVFGGDENATKYNRPGSVSSQFDWAMGGGSSLIAESTDKNTKATDELRGEIKALRDKLSNLTVTAVVGP